MPDWSARLAACALLIDCFPDWLRETPEQTRELLEEVLPKSVRDERLLDPDEAYRALTFEKQKFRDRGHPLAQFIRR